MPLRRPDEFTHHEAQLDGIKIHYVREGRGPPLILMHGCPGFWWEWYKCIGTLANDFDVIAPDMRGYGDLEKPDLRDISKYHLNVVTDDHAKLLQHLGIAQAYMVGHDFSALIMHKFVRRYRDMTIKGSSSTRLFQGLRNATCQSATFPSPGTRSSTSSTWRWKS
jgi:pimeloyl-ACP methyl ester carboxylesterase